MGPLLVINMQPIPILQLNLGAFMFCEYRHVMTKIVEK